MVEPTEADLAKAQLLVDQLIANVYVDDGYKEYQSQDVTNIARAIAAARTAPTGCIIDDKGVVRKVLGTLPVTADGCVAGMWAELWGIDQCNCAVESTSCTWRPGHHYRLVECYSTRAAAEAARKDTTT